MGNDGLGIARFILVISSLSPLFILWGVRGSEVVDDRTWEVCCTLIVTIPNAFLWLQIYIAKKRGNKRSIEIAASKDQSDQLLVYLFAMFIPLFGVELNGVRGLIALLLAVLFVSFIFWHMQLHYMNLVLALLGYRIFTVETAVTNAQSGDSLKSQSYVVISKRDRIQPGRSIRGFRLGGSVLLDDASDDRK
jgi:hypothetical protein